MASNRNQTSIDGALYDLVARGVKDTYFTKDDKESINPFDWRYERYPASLPEIRLTNPLNDPRFGQRCEFEFELPGDILVEASLVIDLPTWLPADLAKYNPVSQTTVVGEPDEVYGYTNGIGYFLFEKLQIFQDNFLLQEVSGDALYAAALTKGTWNQAFLTQKLAGMHDGSDLSIMRNATPGRLEIPIPMIGCSLPGDKGLPLCGLRQTVFRLRCQLRPLEQLVETSTNVLNPNATAVSPAPWNYRFTQNRPSPLSDIASIQAISRDQIGQPTIQLRTKQLYLTNEVRHELAKETIEIPYIRYFENIFSINAIDYAPLPASTPYITRFLDANYSVERIVHFFRNTLKMAQNRLWDFRNSLNPTNQFYTSLQLTIAGQEREFAWTPDVWDSTIIDAKEERSASQPIAIMNWSRGWRIEETIREPTGGINFTTADRPMLTISLTDVELNSQLGYKQTEFRSLCESWALYRIRNGRGGLEYAN
jgi:hypothetical protein